MYAFPGPLIIGPGFFYVWMNLNLGITCPSTVTSSKNIDFGRTQRPVSL